MDVSKVSERTSFKGRELVVHRHAGARVLRVIHPEAQVIEAHAHDWAYVALHVLGSYRERGDAGETLLAGPSAVFHPPGRSHADVIYEGGLETLTVEFDPHWLGADGRSVDFDRSRVWRGGGAGLAAGRLARTLRRPSASAAEIAIATVRFLHTAAGALTPAEPAWMNDLNEILAQTEPVSTVELAARLGLHPAWLASRYRSLTGEGLQTALRRRRVTLAASALRRSDLPLVDVALMSGFCDQSHMTRVFRAMLGRTPLSVRHEASGLWPGGECGATSGHRAAPPSP